MIKGKIMMRNSSNKKKLTEKQKVPVMNTPTVVYHIKLMYILYRKKRKRRESNHRPKTFPRT